MTGRKALLALGALVAGFSVSGAFSLAPPLPENQNVQLISQQRNQRKSARICDGLLRLGANANNEEEEAPTCWNPRLRRSMGLISGAGAIETAYLSVAKLTGNTVSTALCGVADDGALAGGCSSVLDSPYSMIPGTDLPLALIGFAAYALVGYLALAPLLLPAGTAEMNQEEETNNRVLLTAVSTAMGVFSVFLITLLFGVLKESCTYCVASAVFSISLAKLAWLGGAVPAQRIKQGVQFSAGGGVAAFVASLLVFSSAAPEVSLAEPALPTLAGTQIVARADSGSKKEGKAPPPVLSSSSPRAMAIAKDLQSLDARMFGAFWCSHCYDQKERLGKEAMAIVPYVECSKDGLNSQNAMCKAREVPGYPTWEINGELYPGEMQLDELEDIIKQAKRS